MAQPFPQEVVDTLEILYQDGMTGWGTRHKENMKVAKDRTSLTLAQHGNSLSLTHTHTLSLTLSHSLSLTHSLSLSHSQTLSHCRPLKY